MNLVQKNLTQQLQQTASFLDHHTHIESLFVIRYDQNTEEPSERLFEPAIVWIDEGSVDVKIGNAYFSVPQQHLYVGVLPQNGCIAYKTGVSGRFLAVGYVLEHHELVQHLNFIPDTFSQEQQPGLFALQTQPAPILDCLTRFLSLLQQPDDIPVMANLLHQEIHYRIMKSEAGHNIAKLLFANSYAQRTAQAVAWLTHHYREHCHMPQLAKRFGMSASVFYRHFKAQTGVSPIQYQKQLRLQQAQHFIRDLHYNVSHAAAAVGYESFSQFSREYHRLFGYAPSQEKNQTSAL